MRAIRIYQHPNCGTCKKALKLLANNHYAVDKIDIFVTPPSRRELEQMLTFLGGNFNKLFNVTGQVYQQMRLGEKLPSMTLEQIIDLLASNGKLIKRPFVLLEKKGLVGFNEKAWKETFAGAERHSPYQFSTQK